MKEQNSTGLGKPGRDFYPRVVEGQTDRTTDQLWAVKGPEKEENEGDQKGQAPQLSAQAKPQASGSSRTHPYYQRIHPYYQVRIRLLFF